MNRPRHEFLASPAFTQHQHGMAFGGDFEDHLIDLLHARGCANQRSESLASLKLFAKQAVFSGHFSLLDQSAQHAFEIVSCDGSDQAVMSALAYGMVGKRSVAGRCNDDHRWSG